VLAYQGETGAARAAADAAIEVAAEPGGYKRGVAYWGLAAAALAAGDVVTARDAAEAAWPHLSIQPATAASGRIVGAQVALPGGDLVAARGWADEAVARAPGCWLMLALTTRARVAIAAGEPERAERDAHDALACVAEVGAYLGISDILECLGTLAGGDGSHREAARLFGAAHVIRKRMGAVRFKIYDVGYEASTVALRDAMGEQDFDAAWAEGAALSIEEAIAYAQRGRGERRRAATGWESLTPAERDVVRLVSDGLGNKEVGAKLFHLPAHRADPPHPRLHQTRPDLAYATSAGSGQPQPSRPAAAVTQVPPIKPLAAPTASTRAS
jgi:ATP/maltotriose-dependent transcriptional regulator MalT